MWIVKLAAFLALGYALVVGIVAAAQTWLLFPTALAEAGRPDLPDHAERLEMERDGLRLVGTRLGPRGEGGGPLFIGFGGNGWNADAMVLHLHALFPEATVIGFHYRGYSPSEGQPGAAAILDDALAVYDRFAEPGAQVVAFGSSLGSGPASHLAAERDVAGLILVTPFDSLEAMAREHYGWAPVGLLLRHRLEVLEAARKAGVPTALITAGRDSVVPERRSEAFRSLPGLVFDRVIDHAGHNDLYTDAHYAEAMHEAVSRIAAAGD